MKKRINMNLEEEDRRMTAFLREVYGLDNESSVIRFLIRRAARQEGYQRAKEQEKEQGSK
jgi:hypothetical protein